MKKILIITGSLEPCNLHRSFVNGFYYYPGITVIPYLFPGQLQMNPEFLRWHNDNIKNIVWDYKIDLIVTIGGFGILPETLFNLPCRKISWQIDDPYTQTLRSPFDKKESVFPGCFRGYNAVYTTSLKMIGIYKNENIKAKYLPFGFDSTFNYPVQDKIYDISFIGTPYPKRITFLKSLSVWGSENPQYNIFTAGGKQSYYNNKGRLSHYETAKITRESKIALNFADQPDEFFEAKNRLCEIAGSRTLLMTENFYSLPNYYEDGKECVSFSSPAEMLVNLELYLKNEDKRNKITFAGYERSLREHCYYKRVRTILENEGIL